MAVGGSLGDNLGIREGVSNEIIQRACHLALEAHAYAPKKYHPDKSRGSPVAYFAFPGSWSFDDWYSATAPFGQDKISTSMFPSLRCVGNDEDAVANAAFLRRFEQILRSSHLEREVEKAVSEKRQIVFTGHSSGGPMAIFATLWFLDKYLRPDAGRQAPLCFTFGSPLCGDRIFSHALRREKWAQFFIHFVMRYDIVPRIMLAPRSSIELLAPIIFRSLGSKATTVGEAQAFYIAVMKSASAAATHAACNLMGCTNLLLETVSGFVQLSPYKPFGTYIFCTGNRGLAVVKNPDAVLQLLYHSLQLGDSLDEASVPSKSLSDHLIYESELQNSLQKVFCLDDLREIPVSSDACSYGIGEAANVLQDLGLSARARLCLRAAVELEKQKLENQNRIDKNKENTYKFLKAIEEYQSMCELRKVGYYDAFKLQKETKDFDANVKRLELAGIWDEIIEMLKRYELPDEFEGVKDWVELGTKYRRLVEPLDIANYYRHGKDEDTGPYKQRGRPKRYRYTQRWLENAERMKKGSCNESWFWAEVEELKADCNKGLYEDVKMDIVALEKNLVKWVHDEVIRKDVFLDESTFSKWWITLPYQHKSASCLKSENLMRS